MVSILIMVVVCIILIFVLYIVTGGWGKYGGIRGMVKWMRTGLLTQGSSPGLGNHRDRGVYDAATGARANASTGEREAIEVLRDLYLEFDERHRELSSRIDGLEKMLRELLARSSTVVADPPDAPPLAKASPTSPGNRHVEQGERAALDEQGMYFAILDLLDAGRTDDEIVALLDVEVEEVAYVRRIMMSPFANAGEQEVSGDTRKRRP